MVKYEIREITVNSVITEIPVTIVDAVRKHSFNNPYYASITFNVDANVELLRVKISNPEKLYGDDNTPGTHAGFKDYYPWTYKDFRVWINEIGLDFEFFTMEFFQVRPDQTEIKVAQCVIHFDTTGASNATIENLTYLPANDSTAEITSNVASHTTDFIPLFAVAVSGSAYDYYQFYQEAPDSDLMVNMLNNAESQHFEVEIPERLFKKEPLPLDFITEECKLIAIVKKTS
jgi:hypothetical protein